MPIMRLMRWPVAADQVTIRRNGNDLFLSLTNWSSVISSSCVQRRIAVDGDPVGAAAIGRVTGEACGGEAVGTPSLPAPSTKTEQSVLATRVETGPRSARSAGLLRMVKAPSSGCSSYASAGRYHPGQLLWWWAGVLQAITCSSSSSCVIVLATPTAPLLQSEMPRSEAARRAAVEALSC